MCRIGKKTLTCVTFWLSEHYIRLELFRSLCNIHERINSILTLSVHPEMNSKVRRCKWRELCINSFNLGLATRASPNLAETNL